MTPDLPHPHHGDFVPVEGEGYCFLRKIALGEQGVVLHAGVVLEVGPELPELVGVWQNAQLPTCFAVIHGMRYTRYQPL